MIRFFLTFAMIFTIFLPGCADSDNRSLTDARINIYKNKIAEDPASFLNHNNLAQNYIQKGRESGDTDYFEKAEEALQKSLKLNKNNYVATVLLAKTYISMHKFHDALFFADSAINKKPDTSAAYGIMGDAYLELGEIKKAENAYYKMHELKSNLDSYSRISNLELLKGNAENAIEAMKLAYESGLEESRPRENIAWTQVMLGLSYFDNNVYEEAEEHYKKALEIDNNYYLALEHMAEVKAATGYYKDARILYKKAIGIKPDKQFYSALQNVYKATMNIEDNSGI